MEGCPRKRKSTEGMATQRNTEACKEVITVRAGIWKEPEKSTELVVLARSTSLLRASLVSLDKPPSLSRSRCPFRKGADLPAFPLSRRWTAPKTIIANIQHALSRTRGCSERGHTFSHGTFTPVTANFGTCCYDLRLTNEEAEAQR